MSSNVPTADDDIHVSVGLVRWGLLRRRKNITFMRTSAIEEAGSSLGSAMRTARIALPGRHSIWSLVGDAATAIQGPSSLDLKLSDKKVLLIRLIEITRFRTGSGSSVKFLAMEVS